MGSMHVGLEEAEHGFERMAAFYAERARGGVGLIVTGGIAPNLAGGPTRRRKLTTEEEAAPPVVTDAVHEAGGKIAMQILHFGRYAYHPELVAPSADPGADQPVQAARAVREDVEQTDRGLRATARAGPAAGYDGVEIMGSEGYLINQFIARAPTSAPTNGAAATRTASASRWRSCAARASASGPTSS
jgi:2,4-dienoyl-CoA reductase (NADPH2)